MEQFVFPPERARVKLFGRCGTDHLGQVNSQEDRLEDRDTIPGSSRDPDQHAMLTDICDHHTIGLPPAVFLWPGVDADVLMSLRRCRMIAIVVMAHDVEQRRSSDLTCGFF